MKICERRIVILNIMKNHPVRFESVVIRSIRYIIQEHGIGWDLKLAEMIIHNYDGYVDGFVLVGIFKYIGFQEPKIHHPTYLKLIRAATKTPVYTADEVRTLFSDWTVKKLLQEEPRFFYGKKVLFQCGSVTTVLPILQESGAKIYSSDLFLTAGIPVLLQGSTQLKACIRVLEPLIDTLFNRGTCSDAHIFSSRTGIILERWMDQFDIFIAFGSSFSVLSSYAHLRGKTLLVDYLDPIVRDKIQAEGVSQIIEFSPDFDYLKNLPFSQFPILTAVVDQARILEESTLSFQDYLLKWLDVSKDKPKPFKLAKRPAKCAFIFHPLIQDDVWKHEILKPLKKAPSALRDWIEKGVSYAPCFQIGRLTGVVSDSTGQEAECDFYVLPATPRQILSMNEEFLYRRLVQCTHLAQSRGAGLIGLGAYTKVAGDAGITVARRSPIPVTNGNSYSASTTLWAARQVVEQINLISPEKVGNRFKAKAMIIGATGSIGRVSSLLTSLVFQHLVLVANRPDKLLELRDEIFRLSPGIQVTLLTQSYSEISDADLIVTATSNQSGKVLDMNLVKPGAVICDCSRPIDVTLADAESRPDVLVIESGEVILPGKPQMNVDIGLPGSAIYACTAETVLLALEGRYESFSLSKQLSLQKVKEIYQLGVKHGARLAAIRGPDGLLTEEKLNRCRSLALERLKSWNLSKKCRTDVVGLTTRNREERREQKLL